MKPSEIRKGEVYEGPAPGHPRFYVQAILGKGKRADVDYVPLSMKHKSGPWLRERLSEFAKYVVRAVPQPETEERDGE